MKLKSTFQQSEIQDGDIICFQKVLTEKEYVLTLYTHFLILYSNIKLFYNL
jgi:hypothetical protein